MRFGNANLLLIANCLDSHQKAVSLVLHWAQCKSRDITGDCSLKLDPIDVILVISSAESQQDLLVVSFSVILYSKE